jgi:spore maturation protein CgeB
VRVVLFCHSLLSDWNHGNAHFLRGVVVELQSRGHQVDVYEPRDAWSAVNLAADHGDAALAATLHTYPTLRVTRYDDSLDLAAALSGADVVLVHEWNPPALVARIGKHRKSTRHHLLLFHDTHHRSVTDPGAMQQYDLSGYDGVLAFGETVRQQYLRQGWASRVWTWHEAADIRLFHPRPEVRRESQLVWIGNWGDDERTAELHEFLIEPVRHLRLQARVHGVRFPRVGIEALNDAGIEYRGWLANYLVPATLAHYQVTVHVPRRPYAEALRGVPTIRPFEALACGIPLICAPWSDEEGLFHSGRDYLVARTGAEMRRHLTDVLQDHELAASLSTSGRRTIASRHTCAHRVNELLDIVSSLRGHGVPQAEAAVEALG